MGKQEELIKFDRAIKDGEVRLKTFQSNINTLQKELDFVLNLESQLQTNIDYLKKIKIVALAEEYKKAKEELKKIKIRVTQIKSDLIINEKACKDIQKILEKNKEFYDKLTKEDQNNVVQGKFGRKRV